MTIEFLLEDFSDALLVFFGNIESCDGYRSSIEHTVWLQRERITAQNTPMETIVRMKDSMLLCNRPIFDADTRQNSARRRGVIDPRFVDGRCRFLLSFPD